MASAADAGASLPCLACRAIVPCRSQITYLENSILDTSFERVDLYPTYPNVESSAKAGCSLCLLMWRRLTSIPPEVIESIQRGNNKFVWESSEQRTKQLDVSWDRKVKIRATFDFVPYTTVSPSGSISYGRASTPQDGYQHGGAVISMVIDCRPVPGKLRLVDGTFWNGDKFMFPVFDSIDLHAPRPEWRRNLPSSVTLSDENVAKIKHWVDGCLGNHPECSIARTTTNWMPRRLLEINIGDNGGLKMRLIESSEINTKIEAKFAALSHVWGGPDALLPLRLLSSNSSQLKNGIRESELPKNFLDAARVCACLGIRYLWIDSLCIIQNSLDDWRGQAVLMHLVYSHALITIVATDAISCHDGFLERNIDSIPRAKVAYAFPITGERSASDDGYMIIYDYDNPLNIWRMHAINGSKWNTRAWTMQERSLSTRMIHFCQNKIFFECRGCLQSEENDPVQESDSLNSTLWPRNASISYEELHQHWQLSVCEYTSRNLTVNTDRLPAIQSVAAEMAAVTGQQYIRFAGMWRSSLQRELLWFAMMGNAERLDTWRAPSWSWAAVEGQISLWQRDFRNSQQSVPGTLLNHLSLHPFEVIEIDQEHPDPQSANPGFLKVRSLVRRFSRFQRHPDSDRGRSFFPYNLVIDEPLDKNKPGSVTGIFAHGKLDFEDSADVGVSPMTTPGMFMYLHVNNDARATGLMLRPRTYDHAGHPQAWTRIGIASLFLDRSETPILNDAFGHDDTPQLAVLI